MAKRVAIDWDDTELRLVAAQTGSGGMKITDAAVIPIEDGKVLETLRAAVSSRGLERTETLVAIGRGKAELRELKLPTVPENELPDIVRFQALRTFASASDAASVDFLVTKRSEEGIELIAAAIGHAKLESVQKTVQDAGLTLKRLALRPLTAAALYLSRNASEAGETVLIDLLASDAEIVIARDGKVIFVRTVRLPDEPVARPTALAGELRRSLLACGSNAESRRVLLWGREAIHREDTATLGQAIGGSVITLNPFDLVEVAGKVAAELPDHVGRLAPLVGLLACDETDSDRLIDFLNPRKRIEKTTDHRKTAVLVGVPVAVVALIGWTIYSQLTERTRQIETLQTENAAMKPLVESAVASIDRTEVVDRFLDGDVNWLSELTRIANGIPPAEELILTSINASSSGRGVAGAAGNASIKLEGFVTATPVIERLQESLRDEYRQVIGQGSKAEDTRDSYRWTFNESVYIDTESVRQSRYEGIAAAASGEKSSTATLEPAEQASDSDRSVAESPPPDGPDLEEPGEPAQDEPAQTEPAQDEPAQTEPESPAAEEPAGAAKSSETGTEPDSATDESLLETSIPDSTDQSADDESTEVSQ